MTSIDRSTQPLAPLFHRGLGRIADSASIAATGSHPVSNRNITDLRRFARKANKKPSPGYIPTWRQFPGNTTLARFKPAKLSAWV